VPYLPTLTDEVDPSMSEGHVPSKTSSTAEPGLMGFQASEQETNAFVHFP